MFSLFEKEPPFIVSWSHYLQLMRIENEAERSFYEIESAKTGWGVRTLQRQYNSSLYERLALSRDKEGVLRLATEGNVIEKPEDIIKHQIENMKFMFMVICKACDKYLALLRNDGQHPDHYPNHNGFLLANNTDAVVDTRTGEVILFLHSAGKNPGFDLFSFSVSNSKADSWICRNVSGLPM